MEKSAAENKTNGKPAERPQNENTRGRIKPGILPMPLANGIRNENTWDMSRNFKIDRILEMLAFFKPDTNGSWHKTKENAIAVLSAVMSGLEENRNELAVVTKTFHHSVRLAYLCEHIGGEAGFDKESVRELWLAALFHDIGKALIPNGIHLSDEKLEKPEFAQLVKPHANDGKALLLLTENLRHIAAIAGMHHERYDGSGYPNGSKGDGIGKMAGIIAAADAFDAMVAGDRLNKKKRSVEDALLELQGESGREFRPDAVLAFVNAKPGLGAFYKKINSPKWRCELASAIAD